MNQSLWLVDYRRRTTEAFRLARNDPDHQSASQRFRTWKDELFATHAQSALDERQRSAFSGLKYYPYNPAFRVSAPIVPAGELTLQLSLGDDGAAKLSRVGQVSVHLPTGEGTLDVFWVEGYGGGLFLPFGDTTNRTDTYGGGRYLLDTIKGADLGMEGDRLILDFNFAYNPSCAYNPRWVCPLAPPGNRLGFPVEVGELTFE